MQYRNTIIIQSPLLEQTRRRMSSVIQGWYGLSSEASDPKFPVTSGVNHIPQQDEYTELSRHAVDGRARSSGGGSGTNRSASLSSSSSRFHQCIEPLAEDGLDVIEGKFVSSLRLLAAAALATP